MTGKEKVYLKVPSAFVKCDIPYTDKNGEEKTFNSVTLPKGTVLDGVDVGGYQFSPLFVDDRDKPLVTVPLLADREVTLLKDRLGEDGKAMRDADGKRCKLPPVTTSPGALVATVEAEQAAYRESHPKLPAREKVYLKVPSAFVKCDIPYMDKNGEEKTFNSVTLPKGTVLDGVDVGGYQFSPLFVDDRDKPLVTVPLLADREVRLSRDVLESGFPVLDQDGKKVKDRLDATPGALVAAVEAEMAAWRESHPKDKEKETLGRAAAESQAASRASEGAAPAVYSDKDIPF